MDKFKGYLGIASLIALVLMVGYFIGAGIAYSTGFMDMYDFCKVTLMPAVIAIAVLAIDIVFSEIYERVNRKKNDKGEI